MDNELFERGLKIRKAVLGEEYVENSLQSAGDFGMPMQALATKRMAAPGSGPSRSASGNWDPKWARTRSSMPSWRMRTGELKG